MGSILEQNLQKIGFLRKLIDRLLNKWYFIKIKSICDFQKGFLCQ